MGKLARRDELLTRAQMNPVSLIRALAERRHLEAPSQLSLTVAEGSEIGGRLKLHRVAQLVAREPERLRDLSTNFVSSLVGAGHKVVYWIHSDGRRLSLDFGVIQAGEGAIDSQMDAVFLQALQGNFGGMSTEDVPRPELQSRLESLGRSYEAAASITGIPALREEGDTRLDEALEGVFDREFDLVLIAEPVSPTLIDGREDRLAELINAVNLLERKDISTSVGETFQRSMTEGFSKATGWSTSTTESRTEGETEHYGDWVSDGAGMVGGLVGAGVGFLLGGPGGIFAGKELGGLVADVGTGLAGRERGHSETVQTSESSATSTSTTVTRSRSETTGHSTSASEQIGIEAINRQAMSLREILESHLERLQRGRALGMWRTSAHVLAGDQADASSVARVVAGALRGDKTHLEPMRVIEHSSADIDTVVESLRRGRSPEVEGPEHPLFPGDEHLPTLLNSEELALWLRPPSRDLPGVSVREPVRVSNHLPERSAGGRGDRLDLGEFEIWNKPVKGNRVRLDPDELTSHAFVAGTTGSGKTTTIKRILWELQSLEEPIPFMVLEPAKDEYQGLYRALEQRGREPVRLSITGDGKPLRFNPFRAPEGLPVGPHVDAVKMLLRSCFAMQESLPQLLERVLLDAYDYHGWETFREIVGADSTFPTFEELLEREGEKYLTPSEENGFARRNTIDGIEDAVAVLGYDERVASNLTAAIRVRLESFTRGLKGQIFCSEDETNFEELLKRPVFLSLTDVRDSDVRRFLLGALFLRIYGKREASYRAGEISEEDGLRHLLVLEEAHHFVRAASNPGSLSAQVATKANEFVADAIAEMRAYGQGVLVADQSPADLDTAVIRNTNTKLLHRLLFEQDCRVVADSIGLDDEQRRMLRQLEAGECLYRGPDMLKPIACQVENWSR